MLTCSLEQHKTRHCLLKTQFRSPNLCTFCEGALHFNIGVRWYKIWLEICVKEQSSLFSSWFLNKNRWASQHMNLDWLTVDILNSDHNQQPLEAPPTFLPSMISNILTSALVTTWFSQWKHALITFVKVNGKCLSSLTWNIYSCMSDLADIRHV